MEKCYNKVRPCSSNVGFSSQNVDSTSSSQRFSSLNVVFTYPNVVSTSLNISTSSPQPQMFLQPQIIKTQLRNRLRDGLMNDCLVIYIEKDIFETIDNEDIIQRFQNIKPQKVFLYIMLCFFFIFCYVRDIITLYTVNFILLHFDTPKKYFYIYFIIFFTH